MSNELNALLSTGTWSLVLKSNNMNVVGCKWVFRIKQTTDGTIKCYKAKLVAKGFHQEYGINYNETFNPIVKPTTIYTVISFATALNWSVRQLDVNKAFLNGYLDEKVYMVQPPRFEDPSRPNDVCFLSLVALWPETNTEGLVHSAILAFNSIWFRCFQI